MPMMGRAILVSLIVLLATATITARADDRVPNRYVPEAEEHAATAGRGFWGDAQQTHPLVLVAIIGFVGIISAQLVNGWLMRRRDDRERRHETETLRAALIVELKINRDSLEKNVATSKKASETTGGLAPTDPMDDAYRAFTGRLGLLSPAEVHKVMFAYLSLRQYYANLFLIGVPPDTGDRHVNVPPEKFSSLIKMQENLIGPIDEAIQAMESPRHAG